MNIVNFSKVNINNLAVDSKTGNIHHNGSTGGLIVSGSKMNIYDVLKTKNSSEPYNVNLYFKSIDDDFTIFVNDIDEFFQEKLSKKYDNIDNYFVSSLRSLKKDLDKTNVYIRLKCSSDIEFFDQNKNVINNIELIDIDDIINVIPLFKVSLKISGPFKYVEWELLQLKIYIEKRLDVLPQGNCMLDDEEILI